MQFLLRKRGEGVLLPSFKKKGRSPGKGKCHSFSRGKKTPTGGKCQSKRCLNPFEKTCFSKGGEKLEEGAVLFILAVPQKKSRTFPRQKRGGGAVLFTLEGGLAEGKKLRLFNRLKRHRAPFGGGKCSLSFF